MKKTLYSLMLNDEVVREVDRCAHRMGTNRSALINQILAEYVNYTTPERRINDVLSAIEALMQPSRELVPFFAPNSLSMSLKSSLEYKYRPTVKYEVELTRGGGETIGQLSVVFRTQSMALIEAMTEFFRLWKQIEDAHLKPLTGAQLEYALYDGKFVRSLAAPDHGRAGLGPVGVHQALRQADEGVAGGASRRARRGGGLLLADAQRPRAHLM